MSDLDSQKKCVRTAYASYAIAMTKVAQIRRNRARSKGTNSSREYLVSPVPCALCGMFHVSSRNGKG